MVRRGRARAAFKVARIREPLEGHWIRPSWPIAEQVDYKLIGSALARVRWELDLNRRWERDPGFYVEQTLTPVHDLLAIPPPFSEAQSNEIVSRLENIPSILDEARTSLSDPVGPFCEDRHRFTGQCSPATGDSQARSHAAAGWRKSESRIWSGDR